MTITSNFYIEGEYVTVAVIAKRIDVTIACAWGRIKKLRADGGFKAMTWERLRDAGKAGWPKGKGRPFANRTARKTKAAPWRTP